MGNAAHALIWQRYAYLWDEPQAAARADVRQDVAFPRKATPRGRKPAARSWRGSDATLICGANAYHGSWTRRPELAPGSPEAYHHSRVAEASASVDRRRLARRHDGADRNLLAMTRPRLTDLGDESTMKNATPFRRVTVVLLALTPLLCSCDGTFTFSFQFITPERASESETQTAAMPAGAALVVDNDNGSTRVIVDPNAVEATIEIRRTALAETQADADALLAEIVVTVEPPDGTNPNLRITAPKPASATGDASEFDFDVDGDEFTVTGIIKAGKVATVRLEITIPGGHAAEVTQKNGTIRTTDLDTNSSMTTDNGSIKATGTTADLTATSDNGSIRLEGTVGAVNVTSDNGSVRIENHRGSVDAMLNNGRLDIELLALGAGEHVTARSDNGRIDIGLLREIDAELFAKTVNGMVEFQVQDFNSVSNVSATSREVTATLNNGGPQIDLRSDNGRIDIEGR